MSSCDARSGKSGAQEDERGAAYGATSLRLALAESLAAFVRDGEAMHHVYRLAERHGRLPRDSLLARELVGDVIGDMLMGEAKCNPQRDLAPQIERHVLRRAKRLRRSDRPRTQRRDAARPEFIPLDEAPTSALALAPPQDALEDDDEGLPDAAELVARIRELARGDDAVEQLLALAGRDIVLRRDVLCAGMSEWAYRTARDRLVTYAERALVAASPLSPTTQGPAPEEAQEACPAALARTPASRTGHARRAARRPRAALRRLRST